MGDRKIQTQQMKGLACLFLLLALLLLGSGSADIVPSTYKISNVHLNHKYEEAHSLSLDDELELDDILQDDEILEVDDKLQKQMDLDDELRSLDEEEDLADEVVDVDELIKDTEDDEILGIDSSFGPRGHKKEIEDDEEYKVASTNEVYERVTSLSTSSDSGSSTSSSDSSSSGGSSSGSSSDSSSSSSSGTSSGISSDGCAKCEQELIEAADSDCLEWVDADSAEAQSLSQQSSSSSSIKAAGNGAANTRTFSMSCGRFCLYGMGGGIIFTGVLLIAFFIAALIAVCCLKKKYWGNRSQYSIYEQKNATHNAAFTVLTQHDSSSASEEEDYSATDDSDEEASADSGDEL